MNYLNNLLPALAGQFSGTTFNYVTDRTIEAPTPSARSRTIFPLQQTLKSKLAWEALALPLGTLNLPADVLHVPFQAAAVWSRTPTVMTVHDAIDFEPESLRGARRTERFYGKFVLRAARNARVVITVSEYSKSKIVELMGVDPERIVVTPLAINPELAEPASESAIATFRDQHHLTRPYIIYVGGTAVRKGVPNLLRAYHSLYPDLRAAFDLVIVGKLDSDEAHHLEAREQLARPLNEGKIHVLGAIHQRDLAAAYSGASAFVFPSLYEGFGLSPLEAMGCGVPVLTSNRTSMPEVAGDAAILFDPGSVADLTTALTSVLESPELRASLRERGLKRAKQFTWDNTAKLTMQAYKKALSH